MSDDDDAMALREIKWKTLVLGQHQPTELTEGQEWMSQSSDKYPIDIVLALDNVCNVYKVIVDVDEFHTPSRVDVSVGLGAVDEEKNYRNARHARFKTGVVLQYKKREKSASRMEMKQAFTDAFGQYAQRHQLAMQDCRDTAMRTAHVDLLLGRDELKTIGVQSDWTE
ncbi:hypothetical protein WR25_01860 [Diploscapter pachys]|uniref:Centrosomal protein CEP104 N-terminal domain-containing protein n=1 Tax=Diploscapter pachys TaxID=2018661 RepID=A0A2A2JE36_9BILA|nr:hypothetical protein WR25_01860 [Diploscapter pachys]